MSSMRGFFIGFIPSDDKKETVGTTIATATEAAAVVKKPTNTATPAEVFERLRPSITLGVASVLVCRISAHAWRQSPIVVAAALAASMLAFLATLAVDMWRDALRHKWLMAPPPDAKLLQQLHDRDVAFAALEAKHSYQCEANATLTANALQQTTDMQHQKHVADSALEMARELKRALHHAKEVVDKSAKELTAAAEENVGLRGELVGLRHREAALDAAVRQMLEARGKTRIEVKTTSK